LFEQSFFYSLAQRIGAKLAFYGRHSLIVSAVIRIYAVLARVWGRSFAARLFLRDFGLDKSLASGLAGRGFNGITRLAARTSNICGPLVVQSGLLKTASAFIGGLPHMSVRGFGIALAGLAAIGAIYEYFSQSGLFPIFLALAAISGGLMLINRSFAQLLSGSVFMQWATRFFHMPELVRRSPTPYFPVFFTFVGIALGFGWIFLDINLLVMIIGGIVGAALVFYKTEIGIFAAAFLIPLVPTMLVLGLFSLIVASFFVKVFVTGETRLNFAPIDLFVIIFGGIVAYSVFLSFNPAASFPVAAVYILYILLYLAAKNTVNTREKLMAVLSTILISGLLVSLYGIYQRITGNFVMTEAWLDLEMFDEAMVRIYSTLENPNVLGEYLIFIIILAFGGLYWYREYLHKITSFGILGIAGVTMILTQSRGAWLGLVAAFAIFALLHDRRLVLLGIIGILAAPMFIPPAIIARFLSIGDLTDTSTAYRVFIWMGSLDMIRVFWPIGIGLGEETFLMMYHKFAYNAVYSPHSHMLYLQLIIDLGIAGLLTFFAIMIAFFKSLLMATDRGGGGFRAIPAAIAAAMAGFLVQGFTDNVWYNFRITAFFWLILALGAGYKFNKESEVRSEEL